MQRSHAVRQSRETTTSAPVLQNSRILTLLPICLAPATGTDPRETGCKVQLFAHVRKTFFEENSGKNRRNLKVQTFSCDRNSRERAMPPDVSVSVFQRLQAMTRERTGSPQRTETPT